MHARVAGMSPHTSVRQGATGFGHEAPVAVHSKREAQFISGKGVDPMLLRNTRLDVVLVNPGNRLQAYQSLGSTLAAMGFVLEMISRFFRDS